MSKKPSLSRTRGIVIGKKYYRSGAKYLQIRLFAFLCRILTILSPRREPPFKTKTLRFPQNDVTIAVFGIIGIQSIVNKAALEIQTIDLMETRYAEPPLMEPRGAYSRCILFAYQALAWQVMSSRKNGTREEDTRDTHPSSLSLAWPFLSRAYFARSFITFKRLLRRLGVLKR